MGTITNTISNGITLADSGTYSSPLTIAASGYVDNTGTGDAVVSPAGLSGTLVNFGHVAVGSIFGANGVSFAGVGYLRSGDSADVTATISGATGTSDAVAGYGGTGGAGVVFAGAASLVNAGTISGAGGGAVDINGGTGGAGIVLAAGGTIANTGTIAEGAGGAAGPGGAAGAAGVGIVLSDGGVVSNGTSGSAGAIIEGRIGVAAYGATAATIINYGTIVSIDGAGGTAAVLSSASDRLVIEGGSKLIGHASGGGGTLELAHGADSFTGLGSVYTGFSRLIVYAGVSWTLNGAFGGVALNIYGTLANTGVIAGTNGGNGANASGFDPPAMAERVRPVSPCRLPVW